MRKQVGYLDKMGDEQFYYLDFNEETHQFSYVIEYITRKGDHSERSVPLHEAKQERGFHRAIQLIKDRLFVDGE
ncbi:hypothetical protein [Pseudomonas fluorescens]|uniref:hypothetical protein n=1 Tax=Pseudomonas fluorescens TaxID=294 RepID=UPI000641F96F|nr:hypothetical protein [Pseudomonas fluorescens]